MLYEVITQIVACRPQIAQLLRLEDLVVLGGGGHLGLLGRNLGRVDLGELGLARP